MNQDNDCLFNANIKNEYDYDYDYEYDYDMLQDKSKLM